MVHQEPLDVLQPESFAELRELTLKEVRSRLAANYTRQRIAFMTGIDDDMLQRLLAGRPATSYGRNDDGDTKSAISILKDWLDSEPKGSSDDAGYAVTPTFNALQNLYAQGHKHGFMLAITGGWGIGKTDAATYYAATRPRTQKQPGAVRIQFSEADRTPSAVLAKIVRHLDLPGGAYRNGDLMNAIEGGIRPGDKIIFDECQLLGEAVNVLASIYDATGAAMTLQGNPEFSNSVWSGEIKYARLASRANRYDFPASTPEDVEAWLAWRGAGKGMSFAERKALATAACTIACRPDQSGGLRILADSFRMLEKVYGATVSAENLLAMAATLKPAPHAKAGRKRGKS